MGDPNYFPPAPSKPTDIEKTVTSGVAKAVKETAADPSVPGVQKEAAPAIIEAVLNQILPAILHSTNQEPWYKSRVFWSATVSVGGLLVGLFGLKLDAETQKNVTDLVMMASQAVAAVLAIWGRYAKKPLGS